MRFMPIAKLQRIINLILRVGFYRYFFQQRWRYGVIDKEECWNVDGCFGSLASLGVIHTVLLWASEREFVRSFDPKYF